MIECSDESTNEADANSEAGEENDFSGAAVPDGEAELSETTAEGETVDNIEVDPDIPIWPEVEETPVISDEEIQTVSEVDTSGSYEQFEDADVPLGLVDLSETEEASNPKMGGTEKHFVVPGMTAAMAIAAMAACLAAQKKKDE